MKKLLFLLFLSPILVKAQVPRVFQFINNQQPVVVSGPNINVTGFLNQFTNVTGTVSSTQLISFIGSNLTTNVSGALTGSGLEISSNNSSFGSTVSYTQSGGSASGNVYLRVAAATGVGSGSGWLILSSTGATPDSIAYSYTTSAVASLSISPTSLTLPTTASGTAGARDTVIVTFAGTSITTSVPPTGTEVSVDGGNTYSTGTLGFSTGSPYKVMVRIAAAASPGSISGNLTFNGSGVSPQSVALTGTVTNSSTPNDTINTNVWDSVRGFGQYVNAQWNNWAPVSPSTGLTSAPQKYATGVQSPITISVNQINDYAANGATYGNSNTLGYPAGVMAECLYNTTSNFTLTYANLTAGTYRVEIISSTNAGSGPFPAVWTSGATSTSSIDAYNNQTNLVVLDNLTVTGSTLVITAIPSNSFTIFNGIRLIKKNH